MKLALGLVAVAATSMAIVMTAAYVAFPKKEVREVQLVMPEKPTPRQFKRLLANLHVIQDRYQMVAGTPMHCFYADSTYSRTASKGMKWVVQWCYKVPLEQALAGGLAG